MEEDSHLNLNLGHLLGWRFGLGIVSFNFFTIRNLVT